MKEKEYSQLKAENVRLRQALKDIEAIENKLDGGDWDEIGSARTIARDCISSTPLSEQAQAEWEAMEEVVTAIEFFYCSDWANLKDAEEDIQRALSAVAKIRGEGL